MNRECNANEIFIRVHRVNLRPIFLSFSIHEHCDDRVLLRKHLRHFCRRAQEPAWLADRRRAAWKQFEELPMPSRGDEEWMRTDIRLFRLDRFGFPVDATNAARDCRRAVKARRRSGG